MIFSLTDTGLNFRDLVIIWLGNRNENLWNRDSTQNSLFISFETVLENKMVSVRNVTEIINIIISLWLPKTHGI